MIELTRKKRYLFSLLSGILMVISFPYTGSLTPLVFVSWIPLLFVEGNVSTMKYRSSKVLIHAFITFFIYNLGTTWWVWNASAGGSVFAILLNSLIMAVVFYLFHIIKKSYSKKAGYLILLFLWISFEYLHFNWELSWPWLNIGNVFSISPSVVQWYSYTGILGGTVWILAVNILGFFLLQNVIVKLEKWELQKRLLFFISSLVLIPTAISLFMYYSYTENKNPVEVVVLQPNIDPYNEKFSTDLKVQLDKLFKLADQKVTPKTQFVIAPETSISVCFLEDELRELPFFQYIIQRKNKWHGASFYTGASTWCIFETKNSNVSRKINGGPGFFESYNSSLLIDNHNNTEFVHKSKLVLGVEKIPFTTYFPWLEDLAINLDGASGSLGIESEPRVLKSNDLTFAPSICYESIYGGFISKQVNKGAEMIFIITNDGWWGETPGYKQHASFSRLRAIENRRSIARSANTGISCIINQRGDVEQQTKWWVSTSIRGELNKNSEKTFYTKYGDFIGKLFSYIALILIVMQVIRKIQRMFVR